MPHSPHQSELGKSSSYESHYNPELLFPLPRSTRRAELGIGQSLPFFGFDVWNHYEVSWLNSLGKPVVAIAEIIYPCDSPCIIESKSMKLYFNALNNTSFASDAAVEAIITADLQQRTQARFVQVTLHPLASFHAQPLLAGLDGVTIDTLDIHCDTYHHNAEFLSTEPAIVSETLCSDLLKSNCLVTNQPDWCSIKITYHGQQINRAGLLRYLVSFRNDNEFHEQCIEKIFVNLIAHCQPERLTIVGRSTRRGGLDINSVRSTHSITPADVPNVRLCRQ